MKTNNERAKIILDRVYEEKQVPVLEMKNTPVKKKLGWKMITAICVAAVVFVGAISGLIVGLAIFNRFDLDKMFIANFSSYSAIGVGAKNETSAKNVAFALDNDNSIKNARLVGVNEDNEVEELEYSKEKDGGKSHKIVPKVAGFHAFEDYSIVMFSTSNEQIDDIDEDKFFLNPKGGDIYLSKYKTYIIDNRTGKFYSLEDVGKKSESGIFYYSYALDGGHYDSSQGGRRNYDDYESDEAIYFCTIGYYNNEGGLIDVIYRAAVEDDELVVREVFSYEKTELKARRFFVDRYDNIFLEYGDNNYLLKGKRADACDKFYRSVNGIAYHYENDDEYGISATEYVADKMVDKDGNIVDTDFASGKVFISSEFIVKSTESADFYYAINDRMNGVPTDSYDKIKKITWLDDEHINFKYEEIPLELGENTNPQFVATDDYLYFRLSDQILKTEITTGKTITLASDYIFTNIEADNLGNVKFNGIRKEDSSKVFGLIDNLGNVSVNITPTEYEVYYIKPLER